MDVSYILSNFDYNPDTGDIFRVLSGGIRVPSGTPCNGYMRSKVKDRLEYNHRIAWCHYYREQPPRFIDHKNRDRLDNSIKNLRACTLSENQMNRKLSSNNTTGYTGVTYLKSRNKYKATIYINSKPKHLGVFKTPLEASEAYSREKARLYSEVEDE